MLIATASQGCPGGGAALGEPALDRIPDRDGEVRAACAGDGANAVGEVTLISVR